MASASPRLVGIRERLDRLARLDRDCVVFGAVRHAWTRAPPLPAPEVEAFEREHDVALPPELRDFLLGVSSGGAGPYYGLTPLPTEDAADRWAMAAPFVGDPASAAEADAVARDPSRRGGYLVLADQGCGYASVLVLSGARRGEVLADMREAHEGFLPEAAGFFEWYEGWLDDALVEWASSELPQLIATPAHDRDEDVDEAIAAAAPHIERRADLDLDLDRPRDALYPPPPPAERLRALLFLEAYRGRLDAAHALVPRVRELDQRDAEAGAALTLARLAAAAGDQERRLREAARGAELTDAWHATRTSLLREKEAALVALGRRAEAIASALERARHSRELHAFFDVAWLRLEAADVEGAAAAIVEAMQDGLADPPRDGEAAAAPFGERAIEAASGLLSALEADDRGAAADALRAALAAARALDS